MKQLFTLLIAIGVSLLMCTYVYLQIPKIAYVDAQQLFEAFDGKKELEARLESASSQRQQVLDSMGLQLRALQTVANPTDDDKRRFTVLQTNYQRLNQEYQGRYQTESEDYTAAIWKQISQYTREYGEANGYDYIYGIAGTGSLMYGKPNDNITPLVIEYINAKYAGH